MTCPAPVLPTRAIPVGILAAVLAPAFASGRAGDDERVDFAREIRPILEARCFECHGAERREGGLRLDRRAAALAGAKLGTKKVILPGDAAGSPLVLRVVSTDEKERMPQGRAALSADEIARIRRWIDEGATWPRAEASAEETVERHWAYRKPVRPGLPAVRDDARARNAIDRFVLARLEAEGVAPSREAERATLLRRVTLDLTGLPPTPEEVDAFEADASAGAYERIVDRLLASPHFGERWARPWLDLARYADTDGYEKDLRRSAWKWRDWVIDALNDDLPFDRFTIEQIAGDLLPDATVGQRIATGFHRNTMHNREGGVDQDEARYLVLVDRVATTGTVWLGSTLACAQCHDHKYDPFSQKEFHALLAFFEGGEFRAIGDASVGEAKYTEPILETPSPEQSARRDALRAEVASAERALANSTPALESEQAAWEAEAPIEWAVLEAVALRSDEGTTLARLEDGSVLASGAAPAGDTYEATVRARPAGIRAFRLELLPDPSLPSSGPGRAHNGNLVLSRFGVRRGGGPVDLGVARADGSQEGFAVERAIDADPRTGWALLPKTGAAREAVFELAAPLAGEDVETLFVTLEFRSGYEGHTAGRFRLSATRAANVRSRALLPASIEAALGTPRAERSTAQAAALAAYHRSIAPSLDPVRERLRRARAELEALEASIPTALVMKEKAASEPLATRLRIRGSFTSPGDLVAPGTPAALHAFAGGGAPTRLDLARWLASEGNPLVARVTVNRFWQELFGRGIVETSEDFGRRGSPPTHPDLLDWLACEFVEGGWSVKRILRSIVTSSTYRQDSRATPRERERDPENRLLARGPRFRMEAEMVRDVALAASGLLDPKVGGPSVFPYQPPGVWRIPFNDDRWVESDGSERHRRALYTFWRRSSPFPSLVAFDAGSREVCLSRRPRTTSPLQALATLNDPGFVEAAGALADRMLAEGGEGAEGRAARGFRLCTARRPTPEETAILVDLHRAESERFPDAPPRRAWTVVANALLNLDETVTKE